MSPAPENDRTPPDSIVTKPIGTSVAADGSILFTMIVDRFLRFKLQDSSELCLMVRERTDKPWVDPLVGLLPGIRAGDENVIERFVRAIAPSVLRVVRQILGAYHPDVPDVVQEATFATFDALRRYRGDCSVLRFVCRVAALTAMNARRRWQLRERSACEHVTYDEIASSEPSPLGFVVAARRRDALRQLLEELPAVQAEALVMHTVLGWTVEEASEATGVPENTVRSRMIAARTALKKKLLEDPELRELLKGAS